MSVSYKRKRFYREYLKSGNGAEAAIIAHYSAKTAQVQSSQMLKDPEGMKYYFKLLGDLNERIMVDAVDIQDELGKLAMSDVRGITSEDGKTLLPINELDDFTAAAIAGVEVVTRRDKDGEVIEYIHKYKFHPKMGALDNFSKQFNLHKKHEESQASVVNVFIDGKDVKL